MADLPTDQTKAVPLFTHSAVDYFGPFRIKEGRKEERSQALWSVIYMYVFPCSPYRDVKLTGDRFAKPTVMNHKKKLKFLLKVANNRIYNELLSIILIP